jgi:hypothetical protein
MVDFYALETDFNLEVSYEYRIKIKRVNYFICDVFHISDVGKQRDGYSLFNDVLNC